MVHRVTTLALALLSALLISGCDTKIYTQFCTAEALEIPCLRIDSTQDDVNTLLHPLFEDMNISSSCMFVLKGIHYEVKACSNPVAHSVGADFDGYVRVEVFHEGACYYRAQQDFKSAPWQQKMRELVQRLQTDLQLHKTTY